VPVGDREAAAVGFAARWSPVGTAIGNGMVGGLARVECTNVRYDGETVRAAYR
jgi:hypothetical protein